MTKDCLQTLIDKLDTMPDMQQREWKDGEYVTKRWVRLSEVVRILREQCAMSSAPSI